MEPHHEPPVFEGDPPSEGPTDLVLQEHEHQDPIEDQIHITTPHT